MYEDDDQLVLAATVDQGQCNAQLAIPKAWIKKVKVLDIETKQRKSKRASVPAVSSGQDSFNFPTTGI